MTNEDAIKWLDNLKNDLGNLRYECLWPYALAIDEICELLKEQETIVRCKDCKNWVGNGADIDKLPYWLPCKGEMRRPDYFCADGERR